MIHIEQDQIIPENENIKVLSPTGDYNDTDPIEYYSAEEPGVAQGTYHAQFIKYGGLVYRFGDPKQLGEEILKIDPESTHSNASFVRMQNELLSKLNGGDLQESSLQETIVSEQESVSDQLKDDANMGIEDIKEKIEETKQNIDELNNDTNASTSTSSGAEDTSGTENTVSAPVIDDTQTIDSSSTSTSTTPTIEAPTATTSEETLPVEEVIIPPAPTIEEPVITEPIEPLSILKKKRKNIA